MTYNAHNKEYVRKYKEKYIKRIPLDVRIEEYEAIKAYAHARGETVNGFIKRAIKETMLSDY